MLVTSYPLQRIGQLLYLLYGDMTVLAGCIQPSESSVTSLTTSPTTQVGHDDASVLCSDITIVTRVTNNLSFAHSHSTQIRYPLYMKQFTKALSALQCNHRQLLEVSDDIYHYLKN